jgi:hypothetical protein
MVITSFSLLSGLDPNVSLGLRINHEWPSFRVLHDDGIIDADLLLRKLVNVPLLYFYVVT